MNSAYIKGGLIGLIIAGYVGFLFYDNAHLEAEQRAAEIAQYKLEREVMISNHATEIKQYQIKLGEMRASCKRPLSEKLRLKFHLRMPPSHHQQRMPF